jgi:uridine kinase
VTAPQQPGPLARVVLLAGPSGCGKTFLARSLGVPMISLDNFYRVGEDRDLPRSPDGAIDWESPRSWNTDGARRALNVLCRTGQAQVPAYRHGQGRTDGFRPISLDGSPVVVAEGLFAGELIEPLRADGLLADAVFVAGNRWFTFGRRLRRDVREHRGPLHELLRQGIEKVRDEPKVVRTLRAQGLRHATPEEVRDLVAGLKARGLPHVATAPAPRAAG